MTLSELVDRLFQLPAWRWSAGVAGASLLLMALVRTAAGMNNPCFDAAKVAFAISFVFAGAITIGVVATDGRDRG